MTVLSQVEIKRLLLHRYPMLLIDAVLDLEPGQRLSAIKNITSSEFCYARLTDDCAPAAYAYPPSLLCESAGQAACILLAASVDEETRASQVVLFGSIADFNLIGRAYPGEQLRHEIRLTARKGPLAFFEGEIRVGDRLIATLGRAILALRPASDLAAAP